jgi:hypothetical protein
MSFKAGKISASLFDQEEEEDKEEEEEKRRVASLRDRARIFRYSPPVNLAFLR